MGSLGGEVGRKKAMVVYPKVMEPHPSERWGHSASYFNGLLYVFGGCRGGVHFSDVLVCCIETMTWNILETSGPGPGPRDSHSAVLVGSKMIVFGGTNGSKKVNDLHILDLLSREWTRPECRGNPPCARESHTANVFADEKMVVFGGSGEGEANYLNDLHVLDLKNMEWTSPEVRGRVPAPRDSHSSVVVGDMLFVCGGDSGDRYQCDVCVLDLNRNIWSTMDGRGPLPGARAGHASVGIGTKASRFIYVLGGVGDKQYYNDIWVLDVITSSWHQLDACFQKSQGRFSHTATITNLGIVLFGGCGEDERPLSELLILQIDSLSSNTFGNKDEVTKILLRQAPLDLPKTRFVGDGEDLERNDVLDVEHISKQTFRFGSDMLHPKRRRTSNSKTLDTHPDSMEHPFPLSQHSSPSKSDCEQIIRTTSNRSYSSPRVHPLFRQKTSTPLNPISSTSRTCQDINLSVDHSNKRKQELVSDVCDDHACEVKCKTVDSSYLKAPTTRNMMGAEVRGQVDGAFDSGYLMTAIVNGAIFRGVLFPPGPDHVSRGSVLSRCPSSLAHHTTDDRGVSGTSLSSFSTPKHVDQRTGSCFENRGCPSVGQGPRINSELEGVVLTLGGSGTDHCRP
ncbi:tip elongation aberrant protein 1-like [Dorcoceras hygrometricum]|uniref:Tip elongation aberrant protein 1-like n=1 Tax=Dorcoceras hygrometricum TaxID=472368 RepID=A0A2Z7CRW9_9LAMI|nr:tip elongation aberrant protein 1-like [Dorcoceras hygrometricum]